MLNQMVGINANALGPPQAQVGPVGAPAVLPRQPIVRTGPAMAPMPVGGPWRGVATTPAPMAPVMMPRLQPTPVAPPQAFPAPPGPRVPSLVPPWRRLQDRGTGFR